MVLLKNNLIKGTIQYKTKNEIMVIKNTLLIENHNLQISTSFIFNNMVHLRIIVVTNDTPHNSSNKQSNVGQC